MFSHVDFKPARPDMMKMTGEAYEEGLKKGRWQGVILAGVAGIIGAVIGMLIRISF